MAAFAKYDGIDGEAVDAHHRNWIDVLSIDWGVHRPDSPAGGRRRGAVVVENLNLTIKYEKAAPKLLEKCVKGMAIPKLNIELTATHGGARETYLRYELTDVMIVSYQINGSGTDEAGSPLVVISNTFKEFKVTYTEYNDAGISLGNVETSFKVGR